MIFSTDALVAIGLLFTVILLIPLIDVDQSPPTAPLSFLAQDAINVLATLHINETSNSYIQGLVATQVANPDYTIVEQIGSFWAANQSFYAKNITRILLDGILDDYGVAVNNKTIYIEGNESNTLIGARRMVSGISENQPTLGFVARAYAVEIGKNNTLVFKGDIIGSSVRRPTGGNNQNAVNTTYTIHLPVDTTIHEASWYIQSPWTTTKMRAFVNKEHIPGSDASGSVLLDNLEEYFEEGENTITVEGRYGANANEGGEDGSSHLVINYETGQLDTLPDLTRRDFAEVISHTSIRYKLPLFSLNDVHGMDVHLNALGPHAKLFIEFQGNAYLVSQKNIVSNQVDWSSSEILATLQNAGLSYDDFSGQYFYALVHIDEYNEREDLGDERAIYEGSYVQLNTEGTILGYGQVDLTKIATLNGYSNSLWNSYYRNADWVYTIPENSTPLYLDSQLAWLYYTGYDPSQQISSNGNTLYSHPPSPLIRELSRYAVNRENGEIEVGENTYAVNFGYGYAIEPTYSLVDVTSVVNGLVGYGTVFSTEAEAEEDAINRLNSQLGDLIDATEISTDSQGIGEVPSLWGPALVEVRVFK